jgi:hypothetical protein
MPKFGAANHNSSNKIMEEFKRKNESEGNEKEIVFSKSVKAGKRIYYLDVKRNRKDELFLAITESKKVTTGEGEATTVSFEKHKIFLYQEDFEKFINGLQDTISYIEQNQSPAVTERNGKPETTSHTQESENAQIDIDF